jgi:outer membrane lipoprotein-sorting protein
MKMKKLFLIGFLVMLTLAGSAQIGNIFKPIENVLYTEVVAADGQKSLAFIKDVALRLNVGVTTTQSTYVNEEGKLFDTHPMAAIGFGPGYQHYVARPDGSLFNDYGVNLLVLVPTGVVQDQGMGLGLFGNLDIFQVGVDYNFGLKKFSLDTGITLKF